jgi:hypothetical protein
MLMNAEELARAAADELAVDYHNQDIRTKADTVLKHGPPATRPATRQATGIDPIAIAILVVHCAQFAMELYRTLKDRSALFERIVADPNLPRAGVSEKQISDTARVIADKLTSST